MSKQRIGWGRALAKRALIAVRILGETRMAPGLPTAMDRPHFIGIGGAGMSGIAKILAQRGAKVAGSDARESATAEALRALGATVHIGHAAEHLADDATCVVVS